MRIHIVILYYDSLSNCDETARDRLRTVEVGGT